MSVMDVGMRLIAANPRIVFVMRDLARVKELADTLMKKGWLSALKILTWMRPALSYRH